MKAVLYQSNSGHTRRYAELMGQKTGLPVYELKAAKKFLTRGDDIVFLGWLCAGALMGYKKAAKTYRVLAVGAVGMGDPSADQMTELTRKYQIDPAQAFYLQGGLDMNKLHGVYKFMMQTMFKTVGSTLEKKTDKTDSDIAMLDMIKNSRDFVSEGNLIPIIEWIQVKQPSIQ